MIVGNVPYSHVVLTWANNFFAAHSNLHYIFLSGFQECLESPIETTGEVSVTFILSFSYDEDNISVYIPLHELHIDLLKLTEMCEHIWHIHIVTTPNTLFFKSL